MTTMRSLLMMVRNSMTAVACTAVLTLAGCGTTSNTQSGPLIVGPMISGPGTVMQTGPAKRNYSYHSDTYLDVAVPVFNPGFPLDKKSGQIDYDALGEMDIWPQLRRAEAKRFAIQTKQALETTRAFGAISNVPSANTSADLFVLGRVNHSDSEIVNIGITVMDSTGEIHGQKEFKHTVSQYFFRDDTNKEKNPYEPVFIQIGDYVYDIVSAMPETEKKRIKQTTRIRYANYYSPEVFGPYVKQSLKTKNGQAYYKFDLVAEPAKNDRMLKRIETLRAQDMMFVDRLQDQFESFDVKTITPYRQWQRETLPEAVKAREARSERNTKAVLGTGLAVLSAVLGSNTNSTTGKIATAAGGLGSVWLLKDAYKANENLSVSRAVINEMGQGLDIDISPTVMDFNDNSYELTGTAEEQYQQWKAHLKKVYELEATPSHTL